MCLIIEIIRICDSGLFVCFLFPVTKFINTLSSDLSLTCSTWLYNIARGISGEEVQGRLLPKSHGSGKTFPGPRALKSLSTVRLESQPDYALLFIFYQFVYLIVHKRKCI